MNTYTNKEEMMNEALIMASKKNEKRLEKTLKSVKEDQYKRTLRRPHIMNKEEWNTYNVNVNESLTMAKPKVVKEKIITKKKIVSFMKEFLLLEA